MLLTCALSLYSMSRNIGLSIGSVASVLAVVSALLSFAPFTPAVVSVIVTVPLGIIAVLLGAGRTGFLSLYWSVTTVVASPNVVPPDWTGLLIAVYVFGVGLAIGFYIHFKAGYIQNDA